MVWIAVYLLASTDTVIAHWPPNVPQTFTLRSSNSLPTPPERISEGQFSVYNPEELQFGCSSISDDSETNCRKILVDTEREPRERLAAAQALWRGHSRRNTSQVLKFLAETPTGGEARRVFQRDVEASLQPGAIMREMKDGDYEWGTWLAFLRPHKDLVPALLAALKDKPKTQRETMLALGNSGDPRALEPLLKLLKLKDYTTPGFAAHALGYLGGPEVEPNLIEGLGVDNGWLHVKACGALAEMGTAKALPALEKLAKDDRYTGALNVRGMAEEAITRIKKREKLKK